MISFLSCFPSMGQEACTSVWKVEMLISEQRSRGAGEGEQRTKVPPRSTAMRMERSGRAEGMEGERAGETRRGGGELGVGEGGGVGGCSGVDVRVR